MKELANYIYKATGLEAVFQTLENGLEKLPFFIRKGFLFYEGKLDGKNMLFLFPQNKEVPPPKQLQAQVEKIENLYEQNAVLVFDTIEPYMRNQLTQKRLAFVVPGEQLYIPWMFIALDKRKQKKLTHVETFYPATQTLLIYHLWINPLNGLNLKEIAAHLDYTAMTVTRAVRELEAAGICNTHGGRQKIVEFEGTKREVWKLAKTYMKNPVKEEVKDIADGDFHTRTIAGINALAAYTNLAADYDHTYAVKSTGLVKQLNTKLAAEPGEATVQLWSYDPEILAKNQIADPFSVWLSLQEHHDERVQIALEEMIEAVL